MKNPEWKFLTCWENGFILLFEWGTFASYYKQKKRNGKTC